MNRRWARQLTALFLTLCLFISSFGMAYGSEDLSDIKGHWAEKQLTQWIAKNRIQGYEDGSFKPDHSITRAEFMALANRSFGLSVTAEVNFTDLKSADWNYTDVKKALGAGYIEGYEDHTIRSANKINREEAVVMISRLMKLDGTAVAGASNGFLDGDQIAPWSKNAVAAAAAKKIVEGYADKSFKPKSEITRAEAVVMLDRALMDHGNEATAYNQEGTYGPESGKKTVDGNAVINVSGVRLQNTIIEGNLLLASGIKEGDVYLSNVTVKGTTTINGGGAHSIHIVDSVLGKVVVDKKSGLIRIVLEGTTTAQEVTVQTKAVVETNIGTVIRSVIANEIIEFKGQGTLESVTLNGAAQGTTFEKQPGKVDGEGSMAASGGSSGSSGSSSSIHYPNPAATGTVTGYVYDSKLNKADAANKGIAGVTVSVYNGRVAADTFVGFVTSGADGQYNMNLAPGTYDFTFNANGYLPAGRVQAATVTAGQSIQMEAMELHHTVLFVRARDNTPGSLQRVFGAMVTITINNETFTEESNVEGAYFEDLPVGTGIARITAEGYQDGTSAPFEIQLGQQTTITVYMVPVATTISGVVYDYGTHLKQSGVTVAVYQMTSTSEKLVKTVITDDAGNYTVSLQPWMHYRLQFSKPGYALGDTPIYVNIRPSDYTYDRAMANTVVSGNVTNSGSSSLAGVRITTVGQATYTTETDEYGNYHFYNLPEDNYTLSASKEGYGSIVTGSISVKAEGTVKMPVIRLTATPAMN